MVESRLVGIDPKELEIGMEMELTIEPFVKNEEGEELLIFAFKPIAVCKYASARNHCL